MDIATRLDAHPIGFTDDVRAAFANKHLVGRDDPLMTDDFYERECAAGRLIIVEWSHEGEALAYTALRRETYEGQSEMVVVGAVSLKPEMSVMHPVLTLLDEYARQWGCVSMRLHTSRTTLAAQVRVRGWSDAEIVMRKVLT
ncbi:hypothetical protein [Pyruvatibacter mobilis]|uniref:hypothetical protein n=1 Tax=Pyruvatibacter mobilis TaxID=1712261 RepID=UPI003BA9E1C5